MSPSIALLSIFDIALPPIRIGIIDYIFFFCCFRHFRLVACAFNCVPLALNFPLENHSSFFCQYMLFLADIRWSVGYFYLIETIGIEFSTHTLANANEIYHSVSTQLLLLACSFVILIVFKGRWLSIASVPSAYIAISISMAVRLHSNNCWLFSP